MRAAGTGEADSESSSNRLQGEQGDLGKGCSAWLAASGSRGRESGLGRSCLGSLGQERNSTYEHFASAGQSDELQGPRWGWLLMGGLFLREC